MRKDRFSGPPSVSVVVPVKNESETLPALCDEIVRALGDYTLEIVFVDDGSTDDSVTVLTSLARARSYVHVFRLRSNVGKAAALATGFSEARGDLLVTIDADLQDDPAEIPKLLAHLREGYDLVSGWKFDRKDRVTRRLASKIFNWAVRRISGTELHDANCGLKAYSKSCAKELAPLCSGELHRFLPALAASRGFRVTELPVNHRERRNGKSRYGFERYVRGFIDLFTTLLLSRYRRRPAHLLGGIGLVSVLIAAGLFTAERVLSAFGSSSSLLLAGSVCFAVIGGQFFVAGLLAELMMRPLEAVPYERIVAVPEIMGRADSVHLNGIYPNGSRHLAPVADVTKPAEHPVQEQ